MPHGYRRLRVQGCGAGAAERLRALLAGAADERRTVGEVRQVFDRSAYLELEPDALGDSPSPGPPLVLLAGEGFDGPLAVRLTGDDPAGFRPDGVTVGDSCQLRPAAGASESAAGVLSVGNALDIELDLGSLGVADPEPATIRDLPSIAADEAVRRRAIAAMDLLDEAGVSDGLGWLAELRGLVDGERPSEDVAELIDWWATTVEGGHAPRDPPVAILGRGPGATPSGDDVLAGLLVALDRTTDGGRRRRVRAAGESVIEAAERRTTTVSAALLAQATQGRASARIESAVTGLFAPDGAAPDWPATVRGAAELGHTSGVDHLVGVLLVALGIGPRLAAAG